MLWWTLQALQPDLAPGTARTASGLATVGSPHGPFVNTNQAARPKLLLQAGLTRITDLSGEMRLLTMTVSEWPRSAWLAVCDRQRGEVTVFVGPRVEVGDGWLCEGIWDAPYVEGDLDRTDLVFGSGVRLRDDSVVFVSSGTTVDRLHALEHECEQYVSNSLPCLLAATGGSLELFCDRYGRLGRSIVMGLEVTTENSRRRQALSSLRISTTFRGTDTSFLR